VGSAENRLIGAQSGGISCAEYLAHAARQRRACLQWWIQSAAQYRPTVRRQSQRQRADRRFRPRDELLTRSPLAARPTVKAALEYIACPEVLARRSHINRADISRGGAERDDPKVREARQAGNNLFDHRRAAIRDVMVDLTQLQRQHCKPEAVFRPLPGSKCHPQSGQLRLGYPFRSGR
jgi:hypothetical protein